MAACFNNSDDDNDMNYARLVDKDAEFIGKGIKVGFADAKWDWYLPDLNSTAQMISKKYVRRSNQDSADYLRSFSIKDDIGFVWKWVSDETEIFLIYTFMGDNGYYVRTLHNTHGITVDEAILATYYDSEFSAALESFSREKWLISDPSDLGYAPESLGFLGEEIYYNRSENFKIFDGRIATLSTAHIKSVKNRYYACPNSYSEELQNCILLPQEFELVLAGSGYSFEHISDQYMVFQIKVELSENKSIKRVLSGAIFDYDYYDTKKVYYKWPIPKGYLAEGVNTAIQYFQSD